MNGRFVISRVVRGDRSCVGVLMAVVSVAVGCSGQGSSHADSRTTGAERSAAPRVALGTSPVTVVDDASDHGLHSATAEAALRAAGAALGPFRDRPVQLGRTPDGRYLTRIEMSAIAVSQWPAARRPSARERKFAQRLADRTRAAIRRFDELAVATAAGYARVDDVHYVSAAALRDGRVLDPSRPEALMYADRADGPVLLGAMFLAPGTSRGPQIGGPLTRWHYHLFGAAVCMIDGGFPVALAGAHDACALGRAAVRSPEMLHVWIDHPRDVFDPSMDAAGVSDHAH